jgi:hypothetical protein
MFTQVIIKSHSHMYTYIYPNHLIFPHILKKKLKLNIFEFQNSCKITNRCGSGLGEDKRAQCRYTTEAIHCGDNGVNITPYHLLAGGVNLTDLGFVAGELCKMSRFYVYCTDLNGLRDFL